MNSLSLNLFVSRMFLLDVGRVAPGLGGSGSRRTSLPTPYLSSLGSARAQTILVARLIKLFFFTTQINEYNVL